MDSEFIDILDNNINDFLACLEYFLLFTLDYDSSTDNN